MSLPTSYTSPASSEECAEASIGGRAGEQIDTSLRRRPKSWAAHPDNIFAAVDQALRHARSLHAGRNRIDVRLGLAEHALLHCHITVFLLFDVLISCQTLVTGEQFAAFGSMSRLS
jgi:hypothetical protein